MQSIPLLLVDAGTGNLHSVYHTLLQLNSEVTISNNPDDLIHADRVVLPGVGAFAHFMDGLRQRALDQAILEFIKSGKPMLGICVGMQALFESSDEMGYCAGLGLLKGTVKRFSKTPGFKIPHTGWNQLWYDPNLPMLKHIIPGEYAYFNHSYFCTTHEPGLQTVDTDYCIRFTSAVCRENLFAVQFHPEKSQKVGLSILNNFLTWDGNS